MADAPQPRSRRRRLLLVGLALLALLGVVAGTLVYLNARNTGDISHPDVPFQAEPAPAPPPKAKPDAFLWPTYGLTPDRRRFLDVTVRPPFRQLWQFSGRDLLEFPPAIANRSLFVLDNKGVALAVADTTGKVRWRRSVGKLAASSPAVDARNLYVTVLLRTRKSGAGSVSALRQRDGRPVWSRPLPSRSESSPLLDSGRLYFGTENGTVFALDARTGRTLWTFKASAAVKGGPALSHGVLFFGDYQGRAYAIRAANGRKVWTSNTSGAKLGLGAGNFYSTAAVAYGRVYLGNTDGRVYSFAASNGKVAWARQTGDYVYASPAVATVSGLGPTIFLGSYDGTFYALDARTGKDRWTYRAGGKISGSATIVGDVVYFANLARRTTVGLNTRSGHRVFSFPRGGFNPVVSDGQRLYLEGYSSLYGLTPRG